MISTKPDNVISDRIQFIRQHWQYFLALEQDVITLSRFIEFHEDNLDCDSAEIVKLTIAAATGVDRLFKDVCQRIDAKRPISENPNAKKRDGIKNYQECLSTSQFCQCAVTIRLSNLEIQPFKEWEHGQRLSWWDKYTEAKHPKDQEALFGASLGVLLDFMAALLILNLELVCESTQPRYNPGKVIGDDLLKHLVLEPKLFWHDCFDLDNTNPFGKRRRYK